MNQIFYFSYSYHYQQSFFCIWKLHYLSIFQLTKNSYIIINLLLQITRHKDRSTRRRSWLYYICWREKVETEDTCSKVRWVLCHQKWGSSRSFCWSHQISDEETTNCKKSLQFSLVYHTYELNTECGISSIEILGKFQISSTKWKKKLITAHGSHTCTWLIWNKLNLNVTDNGV
jgi:hypothetical protein